MNKDQVVVCGSGIVGMATALGLTRAGQNATLIGSPPQIPATSAQDYCPRVYAISSASQRFLAELGVWGTMDAARITAVEAMEIYGDGSGQVNLHAWHAAQSTLAWIVESTEIERSLQRAIQVFGIPWHDDKFERLEPGAIVTGSGRRLPASLVVGADGAGSPVRTAARIAHRSLPYGDIGLVTHLTATLSHQNIALQWFTGDSVLALLPLPDVADGHQVSMVWSMPELSANQLLAMPEAERKLILEERLLQASGGRLGRLQVRSPVLGFPLFLEDSDMVAPGVALVGDAAHRVHPLAGQGLNLGLGDARVLVQVIQRRAAHERPGELRLLRRYRRARAEPVLSMRLATDGLHRLFAAEAAPIVWARNAGMQLVDRLPFAKRHLISGASGD